MNSNVHPLVVALVLILTGIAVATWMWGSGAAANIGGPAELKAGPDGHVFVQIQDNLIEHDAEGRYLETHNLHDLGIEVFLGGFAFFSNGDILLRRGPDPRSTGDNIRAFQRMTNQQSIEADSPNAGLVRCDLGIKHCERFGKSGIDFKAAYGTFIDWETDEVYFSDTTRHVLRKYSADGAPLGDPIDGFKFPNQLLIHGENLLIADTNHHEIRSVDPATESFGAVIEKHNVAPALATAAEQIWPSHFARVGDQWWVNNMRNGMNQGGIYLFDDSWQLNRKLKLPDGADPIALVVVGDEVWISDWYGDKVRRFSRAGEPLADLESAGLDSVLAQSAIERRKFEFMSYSGIALILLVLGGLAVRGFAIGMTTGPVKSSAGQSELETPGIEGDLYLEPDAKSLRKMAWVIRLSIFMLVILAILIARIIATHANSAFGYGLILPGVGILAIFLLLAWASRSNSGTSIRIEGSTATLQDYTGRESSCPLREVRYDDSAIATHDAIVILGRPRASVYNRKVLKEALFPRLSEAQKVTPWQMQKIMFAYRHPQGIMLVLSLIGIVIYLIWQLTK